MTVAYCHCAYYRLAPAEVADGVLRGLAAAGGPFEAVADLCGLAARRDPAMKRLAEADRLQVAACYPRAVRALFATAGTPLGADAEVLNMRERGLDEIVGALRPPAAAAGASGPIESAPDRLHLVLYEAPPAAPLAAPRRAELLEALLAAGYSVTCPPAGAPLPPVAGGPVLVLADGADRLEGAGQLLLADIAERGAAEVVAAVEAHRDRLGLPAPGEWVPWFPVIDADRCKRCKQCLNFCLFGTFAADDDGRVYVAHPDHCKTNCPACARICPEVAIVFPKYKSGPICGAEPTPQEPGDAKVKVDVAKLLAGDVREVLRARSRPAGAGRPARPDEVVEELGLSPEILASVRQRMRQQGAGPPGGPAGEESPGDGGSQ